MRQIRSVGDWKLLVLHYRTQLQQEQTQREVTEDRSVEQAKRAASVNVEVIKANNTLKQQLRLSKSQVGQRHPAQQCNSDQCMPGRTLHRQLYDCRSAT